MRVIKKSTSKNITLFINKIRIFNQNYKFFNVIFQCKF